VPTKKKKKTEKKRKRKKKKKRMKKMMMVMMPHRSKGFRRKMNKKCLVSDPYSLKNS
jgi:hypothetical protein